MLDPDGISLSEDGTAATVVRDSPLEEMKLLLERAFGARFTIIDAVGGDVLESPPGLPSRDWGRFGEMCREVARRGRPEFIEDEDPLLSLALPRGGADETDAVAVATFLTRPVAEDEDFSALARRLGMKTDELREWALSQNPWSAEALRQITNLVLDNAQAELRLRALEREAEQLSINLSSTYEEISLLYRLTQNLKLSKSDEELGRIALEWLGEVLPAEGLAIYLSPLSRGEKAIVEAGRSEPAFIIEGNCPIETGDFLKLIEHLNSAASKRPIVVNRPNTEGPDWPCPRVRQLIAVELIEGENTFGWLMALNHRDDAEFGTIEANLLSSVAAILGIHGGNIELYRQQSELIEGIIRSLSSAIDAKDPYTCGHSERVARAAVRLAEELGCDAETRKTIYLAGLLHDVGKIGVEDRVLRKPGKLSGEEYDHIKRHAEIGHHILQDLSKLGDVLPVVLHHHESWDGRGYPQQLDAERIPLAARIVAVADAFDAMTSDRPYRKGMPDEKVDAILREGAGHQWDPMVIDAFFRCREDMRKICRSAENSAGKALA
ncbi:MAG: HD-GYP domain-containing protein [Pirellulales bacterium]|nr:HD-GYP domain-containing protein [Pirellulales bacterium]